MAWHGRAADAPEGEAGRGFWLARSDDDGASFAPERPAWSRPTGACGCCGTRALADRRGTLYALYRGATGGVDRDMILLTSRDRGEHARGIALQPWRVTTCPMSSESLADGPAGVVAAWETRGQVAFARIDPETLEASSPIAPPGTGNRKHPALAVNARGEMLLAWAEDTGWQRGGSLCWRVFDRDGRATREQGRVDGGIPIWSLPAVVARPDGGFMIIH